MPLLDAGASIELTEHGGETPLHKAIHASSLNNTKYLLQREADPFAKDILGDDAVDLALRKGQRDIIHVLARRIPDEPRIADRM